MISNSLNTGKTKYNDNLLIGGKLAKMPLEVISEEQPNSNLQTKSSLDVKKSARNNSNEEDQQLKNMFDNAFEEKFKDKEISPRKKESDLNPTKKESQKSDRKKEVNINNNVEEITREEERENTNYDRNKQHKNSNKKSEVRFEDDVHLEITPRKKEQKHYEGPYQKGNWRTLNIKAIVSQNIINSSNSDELVLQGDLIKFAANSFSNRYVVLTKSELK